MINDPNIEHEERPEYDDNGELIWYPPEMDIPDEFIPYNFTIENDPYANSLDDEGNSSFSIASLADEEEEEEYINITNPLDVETELLESDISEDEGQLNEAEDKYNTSVETIIELLTRVLEAGEITAEDNANLLQAEQDMATSSETIKNICANQPDKSLLQTVEELKENMVGASIDDILDILTDGGTKPWLYKDDDNNVLMDGTSIPELTMLVNKLNLIATGGDDEQAKIQLTPEFINMVVESSGSGDSVKSVVTKYYLSTSREELIGGSWVNTLPSTAEQKGKFLWYKIVTTYVDETKEPTETDPVCISTKEEFDGYTMLITKDTIVVTCDENGNLL